MHAFLSVPCKPKAKEKCKLMRGSATKKGMKREM